MFAKPITDSSLSHKFNTVSIIPGIDAAAPDLTETNNGSVESPSFFHIVFSNFCNLDSI